MTVTVITLFKPSDAYKANPHLGDAGLKVISELEGVQGNYHGIQTENSDVAYSIQVAEKIENFTVVRDNKELFDSIVNGLAPTRIGDIEQYHLVTISDPFKAITKPVTEVFMFTVKEPISENRAAIEAIAKDWNQRMDGLLTFGWTFENPNKGFVLSAWESLEAHLERQSKPDAASDYKKFTDLVEGNSAHVALMKFQ